MRTLCLLRSDPDETIRTLMDTLAGEEGTTVIPLFEVGIDYDGLLEQIFAHDRIVTWW